MAKEEYEMGKDKHFCIGCDDNFYNSNNTIGVKECWHFKDAKVMSKYRVGWWTPQDKKENFQKVTTLSCYTQSGSFAYYNELPSHLSGQ